MAGQAKGRNSANQQYGFFASAELAMLGAYLKSFAIVNIDATAPMAVDFDIVCLDEVSFSNWTILRKWRTESASLWIAAFRRPFSSHAFM